MALLRVSLTLDTDYENVCGIHFTLKALLIVFVADRTVQIVLLIVFIADRTVLIVLHLCF
jgi:hypothetical protein